MQYVGGNKKNTPRLVVEGEEDRRKIIESIHRQAHLGSTFRKKLYQQNVQNCKNANKPTCENISP